MTEQQRREQIAKARQQAMSAAANVPAMSDQEAIKIAQDQGVITQEQVIMAAMLGKMINGGLNDLKKQSVGSDLKIGNVDMSKVMPSGIAKAMNRPLSGPVPVPVPAPSREIIDFPVSPSLPVQLPQEQLLTNPSPVLPQAPVYLQPVQKPLEPGQLEFDFDKKARYEDIHNKLEEFEKRLIAIDEKLNKISETLNKLNEFSDKKKLKKPQQDGTQTG